MQTVGIIGLGSFGSFIAAHMPTGVKILGYEQNTSSSLDIPPSVQRTTLEETLKADMVVLAVPLQSYEQLLPEISRHLSPQTLIVDICSVKCVPETYFEKHFPDHENLLLCHPLFGPQSVKDSFSGHNLVVTRQKGAAAESVLQYCKNTLDLRVTTMPAEEHDKIMAQVHALTFFVAKGLNNLQLEPTGFATPSFNMILDLIKFDQSHSQELFETIECGNPYAKEMRQKVLASFESLQQNLSANNPYEDVGS